MEALMCFDCFQNEIQSDFSDKVEFCYGITDSAFPFGSKAVVQISNSNGDASQFLLVYLPNRGDDCFTKYIDEYIMETVDDNDNNATDNLLVNDDLKSSSRNLASIPKPLSGLATNDFAFMSFGKISCSRIISAMTPCAHIGYCSYSTFDDVASSFLSGSLEDDILSSLAYMIGGKAATRSCTNFLRLAGIPSFDDKYIPGCIRHPNLAPVLGLLKASRSSTFVFPKAPYTLENIFHYSPGAFDSEWQIKFLIYQLLSALAYIHGLGATHGSVCPSNVMLSDSFWAWLSIDGESHAQCNSSAKEKDYVDSSHMGANCCTPGCVSQSLYANKMLSSSIDWHTGFHKWWRGELSNFEYLLILNRLAGRRWGDHTFHTVMPWVVDFSVKPDENSDLGWRDLSKSKWRLAKGDEQLDFTYSTSEIPHHVSDECLSELAVCSYKARRLPLSVLRMAVRSVYEPNEYPSNMQRLYQWTPDECIPEFYCDPRIFYSVNSGMNNLAVPSWAGNPEEFIKLHRDALESDRVSQEIHHWIDITFGFKMSGNAAIIAKNVMLPSSGPTTPRSIGRRQLFTQPHPVRQGRTRKDYDGTAGGQLHMNKIENGKSLLPQSDYLQNLEAAAAFCEHAGYLSPQYFYDQEETVKSNCSTEELISGSPLCSEVPLCNEVDNGSASGVTCNISSDQILEYLEVDETSIGYQEFLLWEKRLSFSKKPSQNASRDIFSLGCIIAELYLRRPLFDSISLAAYFHCGVLPALVKDLPPHVQFLVEACIQKDSWRRPSAKNLLESPYFTATVKSSYLFLAPLQLLAKNESCLCYAANLATKGAFRLMGTFAAEKCAANCLAFIVHPLSDTEADCAHVLLKELLKCLRPNSVNRLILPAIQKILQATGYSHLKVSLLQDSFVREVWNQIGKQTYLAKIHPFVISNLYLSPHKTSSAAASVLLIGSSEELGVPITINQTILPIICCFGKGLCADGIDVLVRIGAVLGENFIVRQILPLLKSVVHSFIDASYVNKPEPMQSWNSFALLDCLMTLDGLIGFLSVEVLVKELIEDQSCQLVMLLMQRNLDIQVLQAAATTLVAVFQRIGPDLTALNVLPRLRELFDELAFSQDPESRKGTVGRTVNVIKPQVDQEVQLGSRMDLVLLLYPSLASLLGIEKLRQCCATWLLLEQYLLRHHNWRWEFTGDSSRGNSESLNAKKAMLSGSATTQYNPTKLLMHGAGWSLPQSQGNKGAKNLVVHKRFYEQETAVESHSARSGIGKCEPWFWFPSPAADWNGPDFLGRAGGLKDELPWKIRASVIYSARAHHGALRSLAVGQDESTVFTAGVGPGFRGTVLKWDLSSVDCVSGYYGHEEVVNDICVLPSWGRVASCDGTIHVWNSQTGKVISVISESNSTQPINQSSTSRVGADQANILNSSPLSSGILTSGFDGSMYSSMHFLEYLEKLVVGTGNGSIRFVDVVCGEKLHLWRSESVEHGFPSLVSSVCSCSSDKVQPDAHVSAPSWIAAGMSSGSCRLLDARSGNVVATWRAHDGFVTKMASPVDHLLVTSSLDKTLRIWDLRKSFPPLATIFRGHSDGISDFSIWGQDVISISRTKIGLSSLAVSVNEDGQHHVVSQALYAANRGTGNMSVLSSISILPFSRLFLVGSEDGHLKICC